MACPSVSGATCDFERDLVAVGRPDGRRGGLAGLLTQMGGTHEIGLALEPLDQAVDIALVGADARVHGDTPQPWSLAAVVHRVRGAIKRWRRREPRAAPRSTCDSNPATTTARRSASVRDERVVHSATGQTGQERR